MEHWTDRGLVVHGERDQVADSGTQPVNHQKRSIFEVRDSRALDPFFLRNESTRRTDAPSLARRDVIDFVEIEAGKMRGWKAFATREETICKLQANVSPEGN